jgi:hypothetical protein
MEMVMEFPEVENATGDGAGRSRRVAGGNAQARRIAVSVQSLRQGAMCLRIRSDRYDALQPEFDMSDDNQIEIPQSFIAMHIPRGRDRPNVSREVVLARYEQCEDIAQTLVEHAQAWAFRENLPEREILSRCHQGLLADASGLTAQESAWVILRLAELLDWLPPELDPPLARKPDSSRE